MPVVKECSFGFLLVLAVIKAHFRVGMFQKNSQTKLDFDSSNPYPLLHEVEIVYSRPLIPVPLRIKTSKDTYEILKEVYDRRKMDFKEMFYVLLLNHANYCLGVSQIGTGSTSGVAVNVKEIFQLALKANASKIIVSHNHPSGNLNPSEADKAITRKIKAGCEAMDMNLLDHVIVTSSSYTSFADEGYL